MATIQITQNILTKEITLTPNLVTQMGYAVFYFYPTAIKAVALLGDGFTMEVHGLSDKAFLFCRLADLADAIPGAMPISTIANATPSDGQDLVDKFRALLNG